MNANIKEKKRFEDISRFFFTNEKALQRTIGVLSYSEDSLQAFFTGNLSSYFMRKGKEVRLIDLYEDFPNTRNLFPRENVLASCQPSESKPSPDYVETCKTLSDVADYLSRGKKGGSGAEKKGFVIINIPFDSSPFFWQVLRMLKNVVILTNDNMDELMRTSHILKKLFDKKTSLKAGIVFSRMKKKNDPNDIFQKLSSSVDVAFQRFIVRLGQLSPTPDIFQTLLAGKILIDEENSKRSLLVKNMMDSVYRFMGGEPDPSNL